LIVDMHTHARRGRGELADFIAEMDRCGIDMAGLAAIEPSSPELGDSSSEYIYECVQRYPDRLFGWCSVVPYELDAPARLERYVREMGFKGLKLHPPIQGFAANDPRIFPTIRKAIELDVPILFHTGIIYIRHARIRHGDPADIDDLALAFPEAKMILAHGEPLGLQPAIAGKHPNVYMDTSIHFATLVKLIPGLGEQIVMRKMTGVTQLQDKIMLGSDCAPTFLERFRENLEPIQNLKVPQEVKDKLLGGNAARLLKLEPRKKN
jgi:predicted TIM-barrel fold metal-dependent hydrolase